MCCLVSAAAIPPDAEAAEAMRGWKWPESSLRAPSAGAHDAVSLLPGLLPQGRGSGTLGPGQRVVFSPGRSVAMGSFREHVPPNAHHITPLSPPSVSAQFGFFKKISEIKG